MLVQKKISTKKLVISILIIFFMICGTGFMLYQNKKLTTRKLTNVNAPIVFNNSVPAAPAAAQEDNALGTGGVDNQAAAEPSQILDINKASQSGGLNLNIFSSDKFKNLRANTSIIKEQIEVGKRDPFKPN